MGVLDKLFPVHLVLLFGDAPVIFVAFYADDVEIGQDDSAQPFTIAAPCIQ